MEVWLKPANDQQSGPARIVSVSLDPSSRNIMLGQEQARFDVRLRTTTTDNNGQPSTVRSGRFGGTQLTHLVLTRSSDGTTRLYTNGQEAVRQMVAGSLENWDDAYRLSLANEVTGDRP
jgi:hypothetical protein